MTERKMSEYVFAVPGEGHIVDAMMEDGRSWVNGETLDDIRKRYPQAEQIKWDVWQAERAKQQDTPIEWHRVTEHEYNEMLNILPPACWTSAGFLVGEPDDHHALSGRPRFRAYIARYGRHYRSSRPLTVAEYRQL